MILGALPAAAQKLPPVSPPSPPLEIAIVRSVELGCEPDCPEWLAVQGAIDLAAPQRFAKALEEMGSRRLPVLISSLGGWSTPSLEIARMIRARGLDVVVASTVIAPCWTTDVACKTAWPYTPRAFAKAASAVCASNCVYVLAAGVRRVVPPASRIGVHRVKVFRYDSRSVQVDVRKVLREEKAAARRHFRAMGVRESILDLMSRAPHESVYWMTRNDVLRTRLATDIVDLDRYFAQARR
jgi:hypothetical protein